MKCLRLLLVFILILCMFVSSIGFCFADSFEAPNMIFDGDVHEIRTAEDLFAMADNPSGIYELMNDIDLDDYEWKPFAFSGKLIGGNHRIMNIHITDYTDETRTVYDCNHKPYEAHFAGFFGIMEGAWVEQLELLCIEYSVDCEEECIFTGGLTGYMFDSFAWGCSVSGRSFLSTGGHCFGIGGLAGYGGESTIFGCHANTVLTCIDEDLTYKDEQFMGGAYALGYIDLRSCNIYIDGYDSDHGFVHNGGLIGSYYKYNGDYDHGCVSNNTVNGKITFYEDNTNRRAYCSAYIGEVMNWSLDMDYNSESFIRNEVFDYSVTLGPHWDCPNPQMSEHPAFDEDGYGVINCTQHECSTCGYNYCDDYKPSRIPAEAINFVLEFENSTQKDRIYAGESGKLHISFDPYNASPVDFEIVSNDDSIASVGAYELYYKSGETSACFAELSFGIPGTAHISINADGREYASTDVEVYSHTTYIMDRYGMLIIAAAAALVIIVTILIVVSAGKKKGRHSRVK